MKNTKLLKQNLPIAFLIIFYSALGYFTENEVYKLFWGVSLSLLIFYLPFSIIQARKTIKNESSEKINKIINTINWTFIIAFAIPLLAGLALEIEFIYDTSKMFNNFSISNIFIYEARKIHLHLWYSLPFIIPLNLLYLTVKKVKI